MQKISTALDILWNPVEKTWDEKPGCPPKLIKSQDEYWSVRLPGDSPCTRCVLHVATMSCISICRNYVIGLQDRSVF